MHLLVALVQHLKMLPRARFGWRFGARNTIFDPALTVIFHIGFSGFIAISPPGVLLHLDRFHQIREFGGCGLNMAKGRNGSRTFVDYEAPQLYPRTFAVNEVPPAWQPLFATEGVLAH